MVVNETKLNYFPYSTIVYHEDSCLGLCKAVGSTEYCIVQYDDFFIRTAVSTVDGGCYWYYLYGDSVTA